MLGAKVSAAVVQVVLARMQPKIQNGDVQQCYMLRVLHKCVWIP